jgi:hypothetical protein
MDPNSSYLLKIRLLGNPKKTKEEKDFLFCFEKVIDHDNNYKDLIELIVDYYLPHYLEFGHVQSYDDVHKIFLEVNLTKSRCMYLSNILR